MARLRPKNDVPRATAPSMTVLTVTRHLHLAIKSARDGLQVMGEDRLHRVMAPLWVVALLMPSPAARGRFVYVLKMFDVQVRFNNFYFLDNLPKYLQDNHKMIRRTIDFKK